MQESILVFFQTNASPAWDIIFEILSFLGEQEVFIAVICLVYWNISRRKGIALGLTLSTSIVVNLSLKEIFRTPRPYSVMEEISGKRLETAEGYAFPSGHTQGAATFYTGLVYVIRHRWYTITALLLPLAIGLSRLYLGVHWPIDTAAGYLIGILMTIVFYPIFYRFQERKTAWCTFLLAAGLTALAAAVVITLLETFPGIGTAVGPGIRTEAGTGSDLLKGVVLFSGILLGLWVSERRAPFSTNGTLARKSLRYGIGLFTSLLILSGGKLLLPDAAISAFIRYLLTAMWAFCIYPLIGIRTGLFTTVRSDESEIGQNN